MLLKAMCRRDDWIPGPVVFYRSVPRRDPCLFAMIAKQLHPISVSVWACVLMLASAPVHAYVLGPSVPGNWGGPGATVTYSFMATGVNYNEGGGPGTFDAAGDFMPGGWQAEIVRAFDAWSAAANITFVQVADMGEDYDAAQTSGDIRIGGEPIDGAGGVLAHAFYPPANGVSAAGDLHFDNAETWVVGFPGPGFDIFQVSAHEIGHSIGLAHTAVPNSLMNPIYTEAFAGPQADDIAGAQFLFGAAAAAAAPEPLTVMMALISLSTLRVIVRRRGLPCG